MLNPTLSTFFRGDQTLCSALEQSNLVTALLLLKNGANPNIRDKFGNHALHTLFNNQSLTIRAAKDKSTRKINHNYEEALFSKKEMEGMLGTLHLAGYDFSQHWDCYGNHSMTPISAE